MKRVLRLVLLAVYTRLLQEVAEPRTETTRIRFLAVVRWTAKGIKKLKEIRPFKWSIIGAELSRPTLRDEVNDELGLFG